MTRRDRHRQNRQNHAAPDGVLAVEVGIGTAQVRWASTTFQGRQDVVDIVPTGQFPAAVFVRGPEVFSASESTGEDPADLLTVDQPVRALGRGSVVVGESRVPAAHLVAAVLREAAARSGTVTPQTASRIILVHPAGWSPTVVGELRQAAVEAGFPEVAVSTVPAAVAVVAEKDATSTAVVPVDGARCLVVGAGYRSSEATVLRADSGRWVVEQARDAPGVAGGVEGLLGRYLQIRPAEGCPVIVAGEAAEATIPGLTAAVLSSGDALAGQGPVHTVTDPTAAVRGALHVVTSSVPDVARGRTGTRSRGLWVTAAVLLVAAITAGILVVADHPTDAAPVAYAPETPSERLASFIGEDGQFDCRTLYDRVPVGILLNAGFDFDQSGQLADQVRDDISGGQRGCQLAYAGDHLGPMTRQDEWFTPLDTVPIHFRTGADQLEDEDLRDVTEHRGWRLATTEGRYPDGKSARLRQADTFVPGRGTLAFFIDVDDPHSDVNIYGPPSSPIDIDAAFRQIIDSFEDMNRVPVDPANPPTIGDTTTFTCSLLYDRTSLRYLQEHRFFLADGFSRFLDEDGTEQWATVPRYDRDGRERCMAWPVGEAEMTAVDVTTGKSDRLPGYPVVGADALDGWEEYWAFTPALPANSSNQDGIPTYNLRYCQDSADHCITLTSHEILSMNNWDSTPAQLKERTLPLALVFAGVDVVDGTTTVSTSTLPEQ